MNEHAWPYNISLSLCLNHMAWYRKYKQFTLRFSFPWFVSTAVATWKVLLFRIQQIPGSYLTLDIGYCNWRCLLHIIGYYTQMLREYLKLGHDLSFPHSSSPLFMNDLAFLPYTVWDTESAINTWNKSVNWTVGTCKVNETGRDVMLQGTILKLIRVEKLRSIGVSKRKHSDTEWINSFCLIHTHLM
jgi:hypothetical protein